MRKPLLLTLMLMIAASAAVPATAYPVTCVGDPPRQTEDPLSPACVPSFDGENPGATDQGVTADSVTLVLYNDLGISGDMTAAWSPDDEALAHEASFQARYLVRTVKALVRHFTENFQTYGRTVRVFAQPSQGGLATPCSGRQGDAAKTHLAHEPFAVIALSGAEMECYASYMADRFGRPTFMYGGEVSREVQKRHRGLIWSFMPDLQTEAAASAGFLCRKLASRTTLSPDPDLQGRTRRFGLIFPSRSQRGPQMRDAALALVTAAEARCGLVFDIETFVDAGTTEAPNIVAKFKQHHVTTVVCYCMPVQTENAATKFQRAATAVQYRPEWYWDATVGMNKAMWHQTFGDPLQLSFGMSDVWRQPVMESQFHHRAYQEQEPGTQSNTRFSWIIYHALLQGFTAIQTAGETLDVPNVTAGLRSHRVLSNGDPYRPTATYDGDHAFIDSFTGWWWDPIATPPGGRQSEGCMRLLADGAGFTASTWPLGQRDLFEEAAPCGSTHQTAAP